VRLQINTNGSWKTLCAEIPADQVDGVRDACELLCNVSHPKQLAFQLANQLGEGGIWYAADRLSRRTESPTTWDSRKVLR
jgi:hypothetical protein